MPTYEYACKACGHTLELFQSITEGAKRKCPHCGKLQLQRLIGTGAGILFKGKGFYETDYRSKSYRDGAKAEKDANKPAKADGKKKDDKKSTSKPKPKASE